MITIYVMSFLIAALPTLATIIKKDYISDEVVEYILVLDNGFIDKPLVKRRDYSFQILIQSDSVQKAKEYAYQVYDQLKESYNFDFPQPTGTLNQPLHICALYSIQAPQSLGGVGNRFQYTINYIATTEQAIAEQV